MNEQLIAALDMCLREMEAGKSLDEVLARFPQFADELRPLLRTAESARALAVSMPSQTSMRVGRAKVLARANQLRAEKRSTRRPVMSLFQRASFAISVLAVMLASGTGLVGASSGALPGQRLYPVKRSWEDVRLFLTVDSTARALLSNEYEQERLREAGELLAEGLDENVTLQGVVEQKNGNFYISGLPVSPAPASDFALTAGTTVIATGLTNQHGVIEIISIQLLPSGSVVPLGQGFQVESDEYAGYYIEGTVLSIQPDSIVVDGQPVSLTQTTSVNGNLTIGSQAEVEGYFASDGRFIATRVEIDQESRNNPGNESGSDGSSNNNSDSPTGEIQDNPTIEPSDTEVSPSNESGGIDGSCNANDNSTPSASCGNTGTTDSSGGKNDSTDAPDSGSDD